MLERIVRRKTRLPLLVGAVADVVEAFDSQERQPHTIERNVQHKTQLKTVAVAADWHRLVLIVLQMKTTTKD